MTRALPSSMRPAAQRRVPGRPPLNGCANGLWASALALQLLGCAGGHDEVAAGHGQDNKLASGAGTANEILEAQRGERTRSAQAEKVAARIRKIESEHQAELGRWSKKVHKQAAGIAQRKHRSTKQALRQVLRSQHRSPDNRARDRYRHPDATLRFFGLRPTDHVIELGAGSGWYTEILAPTLARRGKLTITSADPNAEPHSMARAYARRTQLLLERSSALFGAVGVRPITGPPTTEMIGEANSANLVLAIREMHNWHRAGTLEAYVKSAFEVLAPGGHFGVVQHRADADANPDESAKNGYLPQAWLIAQIEAAGFRLVATSEINANPRDTHDHPEGVWSLPPTLAGPESAAQGFTAIGESDRMTLRFIKPKSNV